MGLTDIPYPRVYSGYPLAYTGSVHPIRASVELHITPLSTASLQLPEGETLPARSYVEMYTSLGSAGFYRVRSPQNSYGDDLSVSELEHAIVEAGDWLVRDKYSLMMPAASAMSVVFTHYRGTRWQIGDCSALGTQDIALQVDHITVLEAMISILDQVPDCMMVFDFSTSPWTVGFAKRGTVASAEGRLSRNLQSARIIYDDAELCTRVYYEQEATGTDGTPTSEWKTLDADTITTWGVIEREVPTGGDFTPEEALRVATEYLNKHKNPRISIDISAEELSQITGESFDAFAIGKLFRLAMPDYGITIEQVITGLIWDDVYDKPLEVNVLLADEEDSAITFLHEIVATGGSVSAGGSGGGGGGGGKKQQDDKFKEFRTNFERNDYFIDQNAQLVNQAGSILQQAGMYLDANGVLVYAQNNENNIASKLKVESDRISLVVEGTGPNASIKPAGIWASIDTHLRQSHINISADIIDIDGLVTALSAKTIGVGALTVEGQSTFKQSIYGESNITCEGDMACDNMWCQTLKVGEYAASWKSQYVVTGVTITHTAITVGLERTFTDTNGTNHVGRLVTGRTEGSHNVSGKTLYYLGR